MKKFNLHLTGRRKCYFFIFVFIFPKFKWLLLKILRKNFLFYNGFLKFLWSSTSSEIFLIYKFLTMKRRPFENFLKFARNVFCFFIFSKWKKYCNLTFNDTFKMYCCALCSSKFKLHKEAVFKLRTVEHAILVFFGILFIFVLARLLSKPFWKNYRFLKQISKILFKM